MAALTILHLAPHPDDEALGAGATLLALREAGHHVINLACGLGRPADHGRRLAEVREACRRADFELIVHDPPLEISLGDDLELARRRLGATLTELLARRGVDVLVSPSPHDGHHGHEVVGRAAGDALGAIGPPAPPWWMWGLWADLGRPTLVVPFDESRLAGVLDVLAAHAGELARNDYAALVPARATVARVLGAERAFGYGRLGLEAPYAEVLTELTRTEDGWLPAAPRLLDPRDPLNSSPGAG